ncbi:CGNR zinc finger domain-containing protein [Herbaspirillum sp. alder98]|uniref:CGNR zinc finger domain-containing protein n=1 Tax=Herbaspirillum sp. alder98 TaxID=2913096 RepID=UPI001CD88157|nr:ABATE domain-containing protein [Herbaspirillum sp. alder98]MCA1322919.1 ABATE domain-containing protein [Herbaspirillum sp. alder98]
MTTDVPTTAAGAHLLADHPALDMLNTGGLAYDGQRVERWRDDADVLEWLGKSGMLSEGAGGVARGELVDAARALRETVRTLVQARKQGQWADPELLNRFLRDGLTYDRLAWPDDGAPEIRQESLAQGAARVLQPLAAAAAALLAGGDFNLVRRCEHPECVYWFYDRTKSHRRRWCSMALCGNRFKVARHRQRAVGQPSA